MAAKGELGIGGTFDCWRKCGYRVVVKKLLLLKSCIRTVSSSFLLVNVSLFYWFAIVRKDVMSDLLISGAGWAFRCTCC